MEKYDFSFKSPKYGIYGVIQTKYDLLTKENLQQISKIKISKVEVNSGKIITPFALEQNVK